MARRQVGRLMREDCVPKRNIDAGGEEDHWEIVGQSQRSEDSAKGETDVRRHDFGVGRGAVVLV